MNNRLARLYKQLELISASREVSMELDGKPTQYNLEKGQEFIDAIIAEEIINVHHSTLRTINFKAHSQS